MTAQIRSPEGRGHPQRRILYPVDVRETGSSGPSESVLTTRAMLAALIKTWPRRVVLGLVLILPLVVALLGGFATVPPRQVELVEHGEAIETGVYTIRVDHYFVTDQIHQDNLPEGATAWLGLVLEAVNPNAEQVRFERQGLALPEGLVVGAQDRHPEPEYALRLDDGTRDDTFAPAVPVRLAVLWPVTGVQDVPQELELTFSAMERSWSEVRSGYAWYQVGLLARQLVPRQDGLPAVLVEDS